MDDTEQTQEHLHRELATLRQRLTELEAAAATRPVLEEALRERHRQYQHLVEHSLGLLCIHDLEGELLLVNPAAARALGYPPGAGVGRNLREFLAPAVQPLFDAYLERIRQQPMDSGLMRVVTYTGEERVWLYRNIRYEEPGKAPYVIGHAQDITERVQAEQELKQAYATLETRVQERTAALQASTEHLRQEIAERQRIEDNLRASEERYRYLVENITDVIYATDAQGVFTYLSPAVEAQSGYTPAELLGQAFADYVYEADRPRLHQHFAHLRAGHLEPREYRMVTKAGALRWIRASSRGIAHGDQVVGVHGAYSDITEQRGLEEQRRQAQKMEALGTLAGGIAHDFNNMLGIILGHTELALLERPEGHPTRRALDPIHQACLRARALVRQILSFSRNTPQALQLCHLGPLVHDSLGFMRALLPTTVALRFEQTTTADVVLADPAQMQQVVMNLVTNAAQAMEEAGGVVVVRLEPRTLDETAAHRQKLRPGAYVQLTVCDTGGGIDPAILEKIFDPYFTTKAVGKGTGMGLAVVHGIVTQHGGAIGVQSVLGHGAAFQVSLPVRDAEPPCAAPPPVALAAGQGRILFIDDEPALVRLGQACLERLGYEVVTETRSLEAFALVRSHPERFDLVITDMTMPGMTGERLAHELRRLRPELPIILCTGFSHQLDEAEAQARGIAAVLMKPVVLRDLAETVQAVLQKQTG